MKPSIVRYVTYHPDLCEFQVRIVETPAILIQSATILSNSQTYHQQCHQNKSVVSWSSKEDVREESVKRKVGTEMKQSNVFLFCLFCRFCCEFNSKQQTKSIQLLVNNSLERYYLRIKVLKNQTWKYKRFWRKFTKNKWIQRWREKVDKKKFCFWNTPYNCIYG